MKSWTIGPDVGIDALTLTEMPAPQPGPHEVLVRVRAVSLNFRDLLVVEGYAHWRPKSRRIPVSDGSGDVVAIGQNITRFRVGDRVAATFFPGWISGQIDETRLAGSMGGPAADGMLCELRALPETALVSVPDHLSHEQAATLPVAALTAWHSVIEQGQTQLGDVVLTQGTGGVALFAVQFAVAAGARVIALSSTESKLAQLRAMGADRVVNYRETPAWDNKAREMTNGRGVDMVVDVRGGDLTQSVRATRAGGLVSLVGNLAGFDATLDLRRITSGVRIHDVSVGSRDMFERMNRAIALHQLRPTIDRVFSFPETQEAFRHLKTGQHMGKICITVAD